MACLPMVLYLLVLKRHTSSGKFIVLEIFLPVFSDHKISDTLEVNLKNKDVF
jgi:hypothetical protein